MIFQQIYRLPIDFQITILVTHSKCSKIAKNFYFFCLYQNPEIQIFPQNELNLLYNFVHKFYGWGWNFYLNNHYLLFKVKEPLSIRKVLSYQNKYRIP